MGLGAWVCSWIGHRYWPGDRACRRCGEPVPPGAVVMLP